MKKSLLRYLKYSLTIFGARIGLPRLHNLQMIVNYMKLGRWMKDHGFQVEERVRDRTEVFSVVARQVCRQKVLYLEFGVFKGKSMRYWSENLKHPESKLHGFDSFQGLPEDFDVNGRYPKGAFNVEGQLPQIHDDRVQFFKGWFDQVLPKYSLPEHNVLIVTLDADLYSSTIYVLRYLCPYIKPGTYLYFDDMSRPDHEPKAFAEFMEESGLQFRVVSADLSFNNLFFQCTK